MWYECLLFTTNFSNWTPSSGVLFLLILLLMWYLSPRFPQTTSNVAKWMPSLKWVLDKYFFKWLNKRNEMKKNGFPSGFAISQLYDPELNLCVSVFIFVKQKKWMNTWITLMIQWVIKTAQCLILVTLYWMILLNVLNIKYYSSFSFIIKKYSRRQNFKSENNKKLQSTYQRRIED